MATDYTITVQVRNKTTGATFSHSATISGEDAVDSGVWTVGTSEKTHTINTDLANVMGVAVMNKGLNFVEIGYATTDYDHKVLPGMPAFIPLDLTTATLYLKADTAACNVDYMIIEAP